MQSGQIELTEVSEMPGVYCKYINLDHSNFLPTSISPIKVLMSVSWNKTGSNSAPEAAASWSENVTANGFKACVLVAGRLLSSGLKIPPSIHWAALNFDEDYFNGAFIESGIVESGIVELPTWYTGTLCQNVSVKFRLYSRHRVIVAISHSKPKSYQNAMTVWTDIIPFEYAFKICARELQNFDGIHEGVLVVSRCIKKTINLLVVTIITNINIY